jgi:Ca2+/Na+ antiporter
MSSLIYPLRVDRETILLDLPFLVLLSVIFLVWASLGKQLGRLHAGVLVGSYVLYAGFRLAL